MFEQHNSILFKKAKIKDTGKIASFDLDHTLIKPKKTVHPKNKDDWVYCYDTVCSKLNQLHQDNYDIIIFSNQSSLDKSEKKELILTRIENFLKQTKIPINIMISKKDDKYRKPNTGMWDELFILGITNIDYLKSFYVGDAAGRIYESSKKNDFASSDRYFAENIGIKFYTPEIYFLGEETEKYHYLEPNINQLKTLKPYHRFNGNIKLECKLPELIIMCGYPASGKSNFVKKYFMHYKLVSQDILKSSKMCLTKCDKHLSKRESVIIDNTNVTYAKRKLFIEIAKKYNVQVRCIYMNIGFELAQHLDNFRMLTQGCDKINKIAFLSFRKYFQEPKIEEGFDDIIYINFVPEFSNKEEERIFFKKY